MYFFVFEYLVFLDNNRVKSIIIYNHFSENQLIALLLSDVRIIVSSAKVFPNDDNVILSEKLCTEVCFKQKKKSFKNGVKYRVANYRTLWNPRNNSSKVAVSVI